MFAEAFFDEMQKIAGPYGAVAPQPKPAASGWGPKAYNAVAALQKGFRGSSGGLFGKSPAMQPMPIKTAGIPRYLQTRPLNSESPTAPDHHRVFAQTRQAANRLGRTRLPDADYATYMGRSFRNTARKNVVASPPRE